MPLPLASQQLQESGALDLKSISVCDTLSALPNYTPRRGCIDMSKFEEIAESAIDNYGIVTAAEAVKMGVALKDVHEWVHCGRLEKVGRGVFRLRNYPYNEYCHYAEAVALVGEGAWICGDSVLAMHNLALVNPPCTYVATTKRVWRTLPEWIVVVKKDSDENKDDYNGIPCQNLASVFIESKGRMMHDRLHQAITEARARGLLSISDNERIRKALKV